MAHTIRRLAVLVAVLLLASSALAQFNAESRAEALLRQMTTEEKIDLIGGINSFFIRDFPRLKIPRIKMADGPIGVRNYGPATTVAGGISLAATWDPALAERVGTQLGRDARAKGVHYLLGPGVNIYVAPMNGRNFEYFGEDPFLASRIAVGYIRGVQSQGVGATIKHFMGNNSEYDRHNTDDQIDERTLREIYLPVFEAAVKQAHVGAIMDSYNLVNGEHMTQNSYLNNEVVKKQWGFQGVIMSDWDATYDAIAAANGGLDLEMPSGKFFNRANLLPAIEQGKISMTTLDDKVLRILRNDASFDWLDRDQTDLSIPRLNPAGRETALQAAREGMVLLKNEGKVLPLRQDRIKSILIVGPDAYPAQPVAGGSARVQPFHAESFLEGLAARLGASTTVYYKPGIPTRDEIVTATHLMTEPGNGKPGTKLEIFDNPDLSGAPAITRTESRPSDIDPSNLNTTHDYSLRWTGYYLPALAGEYELFVGNEDVRVYVDDKPVIDEWGEARQRVPQAHLTLTSVPHKIVVEEHGSKTDRMRLRLGIVGDATMVDPEARTLASRCDAVVIAAGFDPFTEGEGTDRTFSLPVGQDELIREMAAANKNAIVVITSGGAVDMHGWLDRVPALIEAWYPGEQGGTALADILFGAVNPSGRLPISMESRWEDNPAHDSYYPEAGTRRIVYRDGIFVGYRGYEHNHVKPLFPFGYGLSYTTFKFSNLQIRKAAANGALYEVSFDVTNSGPRAGAEVAQVYVGERNAKVPRPEKELKGLSRVELRPGETRRVTVPLDARSFSYFDPETKQWVADAAEFEIMAGRSVEEIELTGTITLAQRLTAH